MHFTLQKDGDAEVSIIYNYYSLNQNKSEYPFSNTSSGRYAAFETEVVAMMEALAADGTGKTGRQMNVTLTNTRHTFDKSEGYTLQFTFKWENLAAVRDDCSLVVTEPFASDHDAFAEKPNARKGLAGTPPPRLSPPRRNSLTSHGRTTLLQRGQPTPASEVGKYSAQTTVPRHLSTGCVS